MSLLNVYNQLADYYDTKEWWPAHDAYEVMVGAVLTQNTAWSNVEKALRNFQGGLTPQRVQSLPLDELKALIRPAGFYNQKATYLVAVTQWFAQYGYSAQRAQARGTAFLRQELLRLKGVGPETADTILLYALELPSFVIDAYTTRLAQRLPLDTGYQYATLQNYFTTRVPCEVRLYQQFHALIVLHAKKHCLKRKPQCATCPLATQCARVGM